MQVLGRTEDAVGGFFSAFVDSAILASLAWGGIETALNRNIAAIWLGLAFAMAVLFNGRHLIWLWAEWRRKQHRLGLAIARRQGRTSPFIRPIACLWWLGCFLPATMMVVTIHGQPEKPNDLMLGRVFGSVMGFGMLYAANGYLLLAVSVWTQRADILERVWRFRFHIDMAITLLAMTYGSTIMSH